MSDYRKFRREITLWEAKKGYKSQYAIAILEKLTNGQCIKNYSQFWDINNILVYCKYITNSL